MNYSVSVGVAVSTLVWVWQQLKLAPGGFLPMGCFSIMPIYGEANHKLSDLIYARINYKHRRK